MVNALPEFLVIIGAIHSIPEFSTRTFPGLNEG